MNEAQVPNPTDGKNRQQGTRTWMALMIASMMLAGLLLMVDFYKERPELYHPARGYLMEAAMELSMIYSDEKVLAVELQRLHQHLSGALDLLEQAQKADAHDRLAIQEMRQRLQVLADPKRLESTDPTTLRKSYDVLIRDLNALAHKLEMPAA